jgi:DNA-binding transcriptional LysR family regulator
LRCEMTAVICASPESSGAQASRARPLTGPACMFGLLTLQRDVHDEWQFAKPGAQEKVKFAAKLTAPGDELGEAALAGCGIVRLLACHVDDELPTGALRYWECLGDLPIVAIYRKTRPQHSPVNAFVRHLLRAFERYSNVAPLRS